MRIADRFHDEFWRDLIFSEIAVARATAEDIRSGS